MTVRPVRPADAATWEGMRGALWPDEDHAAVIASFFAGTLAEPLEVLFAEDTLGAVLGFAELSIRTTLPGYEGIRIGYVEGLFVKPESRERNIARTLLWHSRAWARQQSCTMFASDRADRLIIDSSFPEKAPE